MWTSREWGPKNSKIMLTSFKCWSFSLWFKMSNRPSPPYASDRCRFVAEWHLSVLARTNWIFLRDSSCRLHILPVGGSSWIWLVVDAEVTWSISAVGFPGEWGMEPLVVKWETLFQLMSTVRKCRYLYCPVASFPDYSVYILISSSLIGGSWAV